MKIGLYNLEPRYQNLAIEKIRKFYSDGGHVVEDCMPIEASQYDTVYCSSLFSWTPKKYISPRMIIGGTGFNLDTTLPPEIDVVLPRLNIGFTTRGCIRHCPFCVVPKKEGNIRIEGDLLDLWDGKARDITLYDNNILALPEHFVSVCNQAREHELKIDFNQGLDHRLLTSEIVDILNTIRHKELHFAFDHPNYLDSVDKAITLLQSKGINRCNWYVLVAFDTTFEEDLSRLNYLRERKQNAFVQRFRNGKKLTTKYTRLAEWVNQHDIFRVMTWNEFIKACGKPCE